MKTYKLIGKIINKNGIIIGYRLEDNEMKIIDVSRNEAIKNSQLIMNAKRKSNYLVLNNYSTNSLYIIKKVNTNTIKDNKIIEDNTKDVFRDFSSYKIASTMLEGVSPKVMVINSATKEQYILKFGKYDAITGKQIKDYISEYIGCKIAKKLGYCVQEVELGYYRGNECVAIKFFGQIPTTFKGLGYSTINGEELHTRDEKYDLDWLLNLKMGDKFGITQKEYTKWVWDVFMLDMFIGNYDRHESNWGFLKVAGIKIPSPLFDMGASLFSREMDKVISWNNGKIKNEIETRIRSSVLYKGKKRPYFNLLNIYLKNEYVRRVLEEFISGVENNIESFNEIYDTVREYNSYYTNYVEFIDKMLRIKLYLLRGLA